DTPLQAPVPDRAPPGMQAAGACAGTFGLAACLEAGYAAGEAAARGGDSRRGFAVTGLPPLSPAVPEPPPPQPHGAMFVDLQNDVTTKDLAIATQEGFRAIEHVKRYTTAGMATDQGKTANLNTLATLAGLRGESRAAIGLTTFRPPYTPVSFGALAGIARGTLYSPLRLPPTHDWAAAQGAVFEDVGSWRRARAFPHPGETLAQAVARECRAVRQAVGILDASTLGKIEVVGPDAGLFLDRIYTGRFSTLSPGQCRYALLLGEDGFVRDDGVIARLTLERYHVTTTTGGAAATLHLMEDYLQTEFPDLRVWLTSTTEHWGTISVQGPQAARVLAPLAEGLAVAAMPPMAIREGRIAGSPARVARVSF
ncbi:MAG: sarcosine oxidase subunit alpha, partial [Rhodospirillales bacterium]|nr:sarcosine oxidase subunit alpha [Rhodospirillales bacterium]